MTEFSSCLSSLVFGRTQGGAVFFFRSPELGISTTFNPFKLHDIKGG
jgi:hypothetical protein